MGDRRSAELLAEGDVAPLRTKGGLHTAGNDLNALGEGTPCVFTEDELLGHRTALLIDADGRRVYVYAPTALTGAARPTADQSRCKSPPASGRELH